MTQQLASWPWPSLIAHRGGGNLAPENTLSAFRAGHAHGFTMMEYDVKLSKDGVPILLHDDNIARTSDSSGRAGLMTVAELLRHDFGRWYGHEFSGEPIASLHAIAYYTISHDIHSNIEIKPAHGCDEDTGRHIAAYAKKLWANSTLPPLISSFSEVALMAAHEAAPALPKALLIEGPLPDDWRDRVQRLGCQGLNLDHEYVTPDIACDITAAGYTLAVWTVNDIARARELMQWGCHAIVTDALTAINPATW